ncbi:MAG TPA: VOC family protein [Gammaproteobacteria bacterium]|jgi:predicted enzyme related to lactoylglutathione lyase
MVNTFGTDIRIRAPDPAAAARFYVEQLGFTITSEKPVLELKGPHINLYIEQGRALGPVLEVTVKDVAQAKARLVKAGCKVVKDEPDFPRLYIQDSQALIYNLST